jgi:hypothetical protein
MTFMRPALVFKSAIVVVLVACGGADGDSTSRAGSGASANASAGAGAGQVDGACIDNGSTICARACECDDTGGCSVRFPSESSQQFASQSECENAFRQHCAELPAEAVDQAACSADLESAACVDTFERQSIAIPDSCWEPFPGASSECIAFGERACTTACDCASDELCYVSTDGAGWYAFDGIDDCEQQLVAACQLDQLAASDSATCATDLETGGCGNLGGIDGVVLPESCR